MNDEAIDWLDIFYDVFRIRPQFSVNYHEDLHWLFSHAVKSYLFKQGVDAIPFYGRPMVSKISEITHYEQKLKNRVQVYGLPFHTIEDQYRNGMDGGSGVPASLNYADGFQYNVSDYGVEPQLFIGNFAFILDDTQIAFQTEIPPPLNLLGVVKFRSYKTRFIYAWIGVFLKIPLAKHLPDKEIIQPPRTYFYQYGSEFMRYYANGDYCQDENELRAKHGFPPKGTRGIGELILLRTVTEIFKNESVKHRYRGKELQGYEIDIWLPERRIGFEYQGEQHFKAVKHWHGKDGFKKQKERDRKKKKIFQELGYTVLYFSKDSDLSRVGVLRDLRNQLALVPADCFSD